MLSIDTLQLLRKYIIANTYKDNVPSASLRYICVIYLNYYVPFNIRINIIVKSIIIVWTLWQVRLGMQIAFG